MKTFCMLVCPPAHLCWKKVSKALQTVYRSWMVSRCSSCWLKVLPWTLMLGGRISATHWRELRAGDLHSTYKGQSFFNSSYFYVLKCSFLNLYLILLLIFCTHLERGNVVGARLEDSSPSVGSELKSDGPSSNTRVGIAPLPCSIETTFSWEQFL